MWAFAFLLAAAALTWAVVWRHLRTHRGRQRLEDALKHLWDQEYRGRHATLSSLGGALGLSPATVVALIERMQAQRLLTANGPELDLTAAGEQLALQIVRAHRLLERYFADEARLPLGQIHAAAERREHALSADEVERLSASLGHPTVDPHGDPIPNREGALPPATGTPITAWPVGTPGRIVHLEDEPEISFRQILAEGLRIGQDVRVIEATPERVIFTDGENEFRLAPVVAANVFLTPAPAASAHGRVVRLSDLDQDVTAEVVRLDEVCQGFSRRRLMDLGFTDGARVRPILRTFAGDPRAYEVRGTVVALRRDQAAYVLVRPAAAGTPARATASGAA
jgi:DtxR family Mn-dependent transcriptional regulator